MKIVNGTDCKLAEAFFWKRMEEYSHDNLVVNMRYARIKTKQATAGYCQYPTKKSNKTRRGWRFDLAHGLYRISARVNTLASFPYRKTMPIGTTQLSVGFEWVEDEELLNNQEEAMVWILGHEIWHYLCKSKQEKGNHQTKANANGFRWLREFKRSYEFDT